MAGVRKDWLSVNTENPFQSDLLSQTRVTQNKRWTTNKQFWIFKYFFSGSEPFGWSMQVILIKSAFNFYHPALKESENNLNLTEVSDRQLPRTLFHPYPVKRSEH